MTAAEEAEVEAEAAPTPAPTPTQTPEVPGALGVRAATREAGAARAAGGEAVEAEAVDPDPALQDH